MFEADRQALLGNQEQTFNAINLLHRCYIGKVTGIKKPLKLNLSDWFKWRTRQDCSALPAPRPSGRLRKRRRSKTLPAFYSYHHDTRSSSRLRRSGLLQANRCQTAGSHPTGCHKRKNRRNGGFDRILWQHHVRIHSRHPWRSPCGRRCATCQTAILPLGRTTGSHPTGCYKRKNRRNGGFDVYGAPIRIRTWDLCLRRMFVLSSNRHQQSVI